MHTTRIYTVYNTVKDWDLKQIAQDHTDVMLDAYEQGLLDSHLSSIESNDINKKEEFND